MRETTALIYSPKRSVLSWIRYTFCVSRSVLCNGFFEKLIYLLNGGLINADVIRGSLNAGMGVKFAKILLTSYVNAP